MNELEESLCVRMNCAHEITRRVQERLIAENQGMNESSVKAAGWDVLLRVYLYRNGLMVHVRRKIEMCLTLQECAALAEEIYAELMTKPGSNGSILRDTGKDTHD